MKNKDMIKIANETLEQLEMNATKCLDEKRVDDAQKYMNYAEGVRMVLDNIKYSK